LLVSSTVSMFVAMVTLGVYFYLATSFTQDQAEK
jgi:hypothetical protein